MRDAAELARGRLVTSQRRLARIAEKRVELVHDDRHARRFELRGQIGGRAVLAVAAGIARHVSRTIRDVAAARLGIDGGLHASESVSIAHDVNVLWRISVHGLPCARRASETTDDARSSVTGAAIQNGSIARGSPKFCQPSTASVPTMIAAAAPVAFAPRQ